MKKTIVLALAAVLALPASGQTPHQAYKDRYDLLVKNLGVDGVGIETLLNRWSEDCPDDLDMLLGKFTYYLSKSQTKSVEKMDRPKYLGADPVLTLKDSLGRPVNYFQVVAYDDELFGTATKALDRAIELHPNRLDLRLYKISALIGYEKDSPDMALSSLKGLIDYQGSSHPAWTYPDLEVTDEVFSTSIQEYCYTFFKMGTPGTFAAFKELSGKMLKYDPGNAVFQTNLGSYELVVNKDSKAALKIYNKVLKKHPDDYATIKNCVLLSRTDKNVKLEKKFLPMLIRVTPDEAEKASAEARLKAL